MLQYYGRYKRSSDQYINTLEGCGFPDQIGLPKTFFFFLAEVSYRLLCRLTTSTGVSHFGSTLRHWIAVSAFSFPFLGSSRLQASSTNCD